MKKKCTLLGKRGLWVLWVAAWLWGGSGGVLAQDQGGVGIYLDYDPPGSGNIVVYSVSYKSPADKARVKRGDQLIKVDGRDISGKGLNEVAGLIGGPAGTPVTLTFLRDGAPREVALTREVLRPHGTVSLPPPSQTPTGNQMATGGGGDPYTFTELEKQIVKQRIQKLTTDQQRQRMLQLLTTLKEKKITTHQFLETIKAEFP